MNASEAAVRVALAICLSLVSSCNRGPEFHHGFSAFEPRLTITDEADQPLSGVSVVVTTNYWYPSLIGSPKGKVFTDDFPVDAEGDVTLNLKRHPQITKQEIAVVRDQRALFRTRVDADLDWTVFEKEPRRISIADQSGREPRRVYWRGTNAYEHREYRLDPSKPRLEFSLNRGEFVESGGDIAFVIERPAADDAAKVDKPVKLTLRPAEGRLQRMSPHEVIFSSEERIARWGDSDELTFEAPNSRHWPALKGSIGYSSSGGAKRAMLSFYAHPVAERADGKAVMLVSLWAKADLYEDQM